MSESEQLNLIDLWLEWAFAQGFATSTMLNYRAALADFQRWLKDAPLEAVTIRQLDSYRSNLDLRGYSKATISIKLNALKSYYKFLKSRGHIEADPTLELYVPAPRDFNPIPFFTEREIGRLLSGDKLAPEKGKREPFKFYRQRLETATLLEPRDDALIAICYACGLRASEVALLEYADYDGKRIQIRGAKKAISLQVVGVMQTARDYLSIYLDALARSPWANHPALFPPLHEYPTRTHRGVGLSDEGVAYALARRIERAGIVQGRRARLSPHLFRYSIATHFYERGYPVPEIQRHLRHRQITTTMRYINLGSSGLPRLRPYRIHPWMRGKPFLPDSD